MNARDTTRAVAFTSERRSSVRVELELLLAERKAA